MNQASSDCHGSTLVAKSVWQERKIEVKTPFKLQDNDKGNQVKAANARLYFSYNEDFGSLPFGNRGSIHLLLS